MRQRYRVELLEPLEANALPSVSTKLAGRFGRDPERLQRTLARSGHLSTPLALDEAEQLARVCERFGLSVGISAA